MPLVNVDLTSIVVSPISVIQLLKPVLDDAYARIGGNDIEKDAAINNAVEYFIAHYRDLRDGAEIDYSPAARRFAYVLRYVTAHSSIVVDIIRRSTELKALFERSELEVASIGGGPGSEMVALMKYAAERSKKTAFTFHLYDRDNSWGDTWKRVHKKLNLKVDTFPMFKHLDACKEETWTQDALSEADIITMVYFVSEVFRQRNAVEPFFKKLLEGAKHGALVLYVDNSAGGFTEWFDELASAASLTRLDGSDGEVIAVPPLEEKSDFGEYYEKFGAPKIKSDLAWRILRKQGGE